ncbi:MAG: class I SAM-dependent methyltransferase [Nanoarchaeota archaeon]|nr:class I SAM-dependent methyltransferase [Nanoarchaeota archaeon]
MNPPKITPDMQMYRLKDLWQATQGDKNPEEFFRERIGRTYSSLEEELICGLPLFDQQEQEELTAKAVAIAAPLALQFPDQRAFKAVAEKDPELGKNINAVGLINFQHLMQTKFYEECMPLWQASEQHEFPLSYKKVEDTNFMGARAKCVETFNYGGAGAYRPLFYATMRHLSNIQGGENTADIRQKAKKALEGKRVLELGSGPGFFLRFLEDLSSCETLGIDMNEEAAKASKKLGVHVVYGDTRKLQDVVGDRTFDLIVSKDFLSYAVTKEDARPIMEGVYRALAPKGVTVHTIDYGKMGEDRYLGFIKESAVSLGGNAEELISNFQRMDPQQKDIMLRKNILNIGPGSLDDIGFNPWSFLRLDCEDNLSMALVRGVAK